MESLWKAAGAAAWGAAALGGLQPFLTPEAAAEIQARCPGARGVLVAAFPYYAGRAPGNLSLYCRGEDYHRVILRRLEPVCRALMERHPGHAFVPGADSSPVPELAAAELAGVGFRGRHGLRIVPPYGSYVFLGTVLTDLALPATGPREGTLCPPNCRACQQACPTGALGEGGCQVTRCLSHWSQEKGDLPPEMAQALRASPTVWGCDRCQTACPHNQGAALSPLPEFREDLIPTLTPQDLAGLSNKAFRRTYGHRAFAWRGIAPLRRNLALQGEGLSPTPQKKPPAPDENRRSG